MYLCNCIDNLQWQWYLSDLRPFSSTFPIVQASSHNPRRCTKDSYDLICRCRQGPGSC
ncbi:unnamed protein product [Linum tenue]|uniref:Uncharacterized protein n=1 Tax=Linum tenue TaxID=586396 RepID=A0AAV0Q2J7_9ROSI|nr:unnamed protein product [Linum tenue]